jgi:demethylmenaquinone methyltransferase/2-methoxy-6-polyprenyl-1,4-benzoquinol methylase
MNHAAHTPHTKATYFNEVAEFWDSWESRDPTAALRLEQGLCDLELRDDEIVVDVGCGTGNLTQVLLKQLSSKARVIGIDIAPRMVEIARRKIRDERAVWYIGDAAKLPLPSDSVNRVICFSVWPHFEDPLACAAEFHRVLMPGGLLHVWHLLSRERINSIHASAGEAVRADILRSGIEVAGLLTGAGFAWRAVTDNEEVYLVTVAKRLT